MPCRLPKPQYKCHVVHLDANSNPPCLATCARAGLVVYWLLGSPLGEPGAIPQLATYNDCIRRYAAQSTWLGMFPHMICSHSLCSAH